ncbi:MAG: hypothetical protein H0W44_01505 [Gammaproteobacteria bacterium]|nr:hypothetical protein [Gammaproteobacteria bacterium]
MRNTKKYIQLGLISVTALFILNGCSRSAKPEAAPTQNEASTTAAQKPAKTAKTARGTVNADGGIEGKITAGSKFSKIKINMTDKEVVALIGQPTTRRAHLTGKAFIPFHRGNDTARMIVAYQGEGTIVYQTVRCGWHCSVFKVYKIIVDKKETGAPDKK